MPIIYVMAHIHIRILHSGSKARDRGDFQEPWLGGSLSLYTIILMFMWSLEPREQWSNGDFIGEIQVQGPADVAAESNASV